VNDAFVLFSRFLFDWTKSEDAMRPQSGDAVLVYHRVTTEEGTELESSFGKKDPFRFTVDSNRVIKGMNKAVKELEVGEKTSVIVPAAEAHGEFNERSYKSVRKTAFFKGVKVGQTITFQGELGEPIQARVVREDGELVILDTNHPLAGQNLMLEIELVEILSDAVRAPFI